MKVIKKQSIWHFYLGYLNDSLNVLKLQKKNLQKIKLTRISVYDT
jgi:hypothetical protein